MMYSEHVTHNILCITAISIIFSDQEKAFHEVCKHFGILHLNQYRFLVANNADTLLKFPTPNFNIPYGINGYGVSNFRNQSSSVDLSLVR